MIISKTPLRVSLGGGGTDLPFFYQKHGGFVISAAIQKYMYIIISHRFEKDFRVSYSETEICDSVSKIKHPIVRESLKITKLNDPVEIISVSNVPARTGLGSSGSFTVGLLHAIYSYQKKDIVRKELAETACHIEIDVLKEPVGKQDQYAAAFGGLCCLTMDEAGKVTVTPLKISEETKDDLENRLVFIYTGLTRSAGEVLQDVQKKKSNPSDEYLLKIKEIGYETKKSLEKGDLDNFGRLMHQHWEEKKRTSNKISSGKIDKYYTMALNSGALGGKIIGAGGGGFLMFYCNNDDSKKNLVKKFRSHGLEEVKFRFEPDGSKIISDMTGGSN
jgi:D-glycero-alpha-D-manno-heptose-7-phosphate kinase